MPRKKDPNILIEEVEEAAEPISSNGTERDTRPSLEEKPARRRKAAAVPVQ